MPSAVHLLVPAVYHWHVLANGMVNVMFIHRLVQVLAAHPDSVTDALAGVVLQYSQPLESQ